MFEWLRRLTAQKRAEHRSGPMAGWVSVWVGNLTDELDLDGYLYEFDKDHQLSQRGDDGEYTVRESSAPLRELLDGLYASNKWLPELLALSTARSIETASCAVVQLHYRHEPVAEAPGPLTFVGTVRLADG